MKANKFIHVWIAVTIAFSSLFVDIQSTSAVSITNDRYIGNQSHLKQIRADKVWGKVNSNTGITIAVLDSGVDLNHPDLKDNLLPGVNLVSPGKSPQDDNGHGTEVTGILAAKGNNGMGVSGVLWNARILPIKVLDRGARADISLIAKGIRTAIDRGAKVVLMSFESISYSKELEDAVAKAEASGVLLVAATGNQGNRVAFPAAYPTVLAVGAVDSKNEPIYQSNFGPELKIMAPGKNIYTTRMGGKYGSISGTSAAAPQVAGAAALILAKNPKMTPLEVRQLLYQTTIDLAPSGWDRKTGYGVLDVNRAIRTSPLSDINEPNNSLSSAKAFPIEAQLRAQLTQNDPMDWYYMDVPYDGKVTFTASVSSNVATPLAATFYQDNRQPVTYYVGNGDMLTIPAKVGRMDMKLQRSGGVLGFSYLLTSKFTINPDRYERNPDTSTARPLVGNQISIIGNFHEASDQDWFSYYVREYGKLNVTVTTDTKRIDLKIVMGKQGSGWDPPYDNSTESDPTERIQKEVSPGKYYIGLSEYWKNAVNGEYKMDVTYTPIRKDTNEPNDTYRNAAPLINGLLMTGTVSSTSDYDWFQFQVDSESYVSIRAPYIPVSTGVRIALFNGETFNYSLATENEVAELSDKGKEVLGLKLRPGKYYVRINSVTPFKYDTYRLTVNQEKLIDGYRDISSHWARNDIARLSRLGVVKGFEDATFLPNQSVTRAQFATMLIQAMRAKGLSVGNYTGKKPFKDLSQSHWAYNNMMQAYRLGILQGYPNQTIKPNYPLTRAEMALMVARAHNALLYKRSESTYLDVLTTHWASPAIEALTNRGWLQGYRDYRGNRFRPQAIATRAEMIVLIAKAYKL